MIPLTLTPWMTLLSCLQVPLFAPCVSASSLSLPGIIPPNIQTTLGPLLSRSSQILFPSSSSFANYSARWRNDDRPAYAVIVVPATEKDVISTVKYANSHKIPFFSQSGGHASYSGLENFRGGLGISLTSLDKITFDNSGNTATIQGGVNVHNVLNVLWEKGKQTTTGTCGCVGAVSPGLGGGHGLLQGQYGLVGDQFLSARVVLWNGTLIIVSENQHKELFWALRGAGHNFGIVTELKIKVHDVAEKNWSYESFTFTGDKLEKRYKLAQEKVGSQPKELVIWNLWAMNKAVDANKPVINWKFIYNGPATKLKTFTKDVLSKIGPGAAYDVGSVTYPNLLKWMGNDIESFVCEKGNNAFTRAAYVRDYEIPALRRWYNRFGDMLRAEPALEKSVCFVEGYSTQGVEAVPERRTAYAHRRQRLLL